MPEADTQTLTNQSPTSGAPQVCVSVARGRHRMMIAEHRHVAAQGIRLVEWRLDYIRRPVNVRRLIEDRRCPAIATCRRPQEGGKWQRSETDRLALLRTAIADGVDYVDLEADIAPTIPRYGKTKRIVSYHNFHDTPRNLESIHEMLCEMDPDIIKIATMANSPMDNLATLRLCANRRVPTVAFCMGEMGVPSRILCGKFGSPITFAAMHQDRQIAPGQLSYQQMMRDYRFEQIQPTTRVLGLIADPVGHSFSPRVHNACIQATGLDMVYVPFRVPAQHLDAFVAVAEQLDIIGLSVTIPHKEKILRHLTVVDDNVSLTKAANTLVFKDDNVFGYNTDCEAALESLKTELPMISDSKPLQGYRVVLLGAGGVARAIAFTLHRNGATVIICARDYRKAESLAGQVGCKAIDWPARQNVDCHVLVNCTPVGMHPNINHTPFEQGWLDKRMLVFDTIYNPEQTLLIKQAKEAGCRTLSGVDMFARQAARQFSLMTDHQADIQMIREVISRAISAAQYA